MDALYQSYKSCRNAAWLCLIHCGICKLPIKLTDICKAYGIKLIKNADIDILREYEDGLSVCINSKCHIDWYIVYRETLPRGRIRFTIAHEIGHILLGHLSEAQTRSKVKSSNKPIQETEADMFAARLLMPACVLHEIGVTKPEDITRVCDVSNKAAIIRAERIKQLNERDAFYKHNLEKKLVQQFDYYINSYNL